MSMRTGFLHQTIGFLLHGSIRSHRFAWTDSHQCKSPLLDGVARGHGDVFNRAVRLMSDLCLPLQDAYGRTDAVVHMAVEGLYPAVCCHNQEAWQGLGGRA